MNKFSGPDDSNFILVKEVIKGLSHNAPSLLAHRGISSHPAVPLDAVGMPDQHVENAPVRDPLDASNSDMSLNRNKAEVDSKSRHPNCSNLAAGSFLCNQGNAKN